MINIIDKVNCVGCAACVQRCPKQCIAFSTDSEGFLYPNVDLDLCIECGLCERVCPVIHQGDEKEPIECYASRSTSADTLDKSSSGGLFGLLAENVLNRGGVVFGAAFAPDMSVRHQIVEDIADLSKIQRSKYSQSVIGTSYIEAEQKLKEGKEVLFSGTPCQIAGLKLFLRKDYPNLTTVDVACHSVPSPKVWKAYVDSKRELGFNDVNFRNKKNGWLHYGFSLNRGNEEVFYQPSSQNEFMQGFLKDLYSRPSCSRCPAKAGRSGSDITLADFWGIWNVLPDFECRDGASAVMIHTAGGQRAFDEISQFTDSRKVNYENIVKGNPALVKSAVFPPQRNEFWTRFPKEGIGCISPIVATMRPAFAKRVANFILRKLRLR